MAVDTTSGGNAINITVIESGIGIASGNGNAGGDIQLLEVVSVLQVAAAIQLVVDFHDFGVWMPAALRYDLLPL